MKRCLSCGKSYIDPVKHIREKHPISCEEVISKSPNYSSGELDDETDERISCHIAYCKQCSGALSNKVEVLKGLES